MTADPHALPQLLELQLPKEASEFETHLGDRRIGPVARLNVLVGPNNSGKSRLLRALFAQRPVVGAWTTQPDVELIQERVAADEYFENEIADEFRTNDAREFLSTLRPALRAAGEKSPGRLTAHAKLEMDGGVKVKVFQDKNNPNNYSTVKLRDDHLRDRVSRMVHLTNKAKDSVDLPSFRHVYIPTLRSLRPLSDDPAAYIDRTRIDYFGSTDWLTGSARTKWREGSIATGLEYYAQIRDHLLGDLEEREAIREFEAFLGNSFFNGASVALIPKAKGAKDRSEVLWIKIGNEEEKPIHDLGDGVQQVVILTLPLFLNQKENLLLFIEEPDLYLHPGFQRRLIDKILEPRSGLLHVFVATHSSQFLDITIDRANCSIFRCRKMPPQDNLARSYVPRFDVQLLESDDRSILRELGIYNSSIFLTNCTIWVEGVTDRWYLRRYLELYQAELKRKAEERSPPDIPRLFLEDFHFSFVEYGGSAITHWSFLDVEEYPIDVERLCGELLLIADGDDSRKQVRHAYLEQRLGDRFVKLECKEIENTLSPKTLTEIVRSYERNAGIEPLSPFAFDDYRYEPLGEFLESRFFDDSRTKVREGSYADRKTVADKDRFCEKALGAMNSFADLTNEAQRVAKLMHEFISAHNLDRRHEGEPNV